MILSLAHFLFTEEKKRLMTYHSDEPPCRLRPSLANRLGPSPRLHERVGHRYLCCTMCTSHCLYMYMCLHVYVPVRSTVSVLATIGPADMGDIREMLLPLLRSTRDEGEQNCLHRRHPEPQCSPRESMNLTTDHPDVASENLRYCTCTHAIKAVFD